MDKNRFQDLLLKYRDSLLSEQELQELKLLSEDPENEGLLADDFASIFRISERHPSWNPEKENELLQKLKEQLQMDISADSNRKSIGQNDLNPAGQYNMHPTGQNEFIPFGQNILKPFRKKVFSWRMAAAAAIIIVCMGGWYLLRSKPSIPVNTGLISKDVPPGRNYAMLTLSDGQKIALDSNKNGLIAHERGTAVVNLKGCLSYKSQEQTGEITYNTIETGRGNQYKIILPDGSVVWLNSASSLRFPTSFTGNDRKVILTGEGYFDVAKNAAQSFTVVFGNSDVKVLGTAFNVMAYPDEPSQKTTLINGSILIRKGTQSTLLQPGKEAVITTGRIEVKEADTDQAIAWKNGQISFANAGLEEITRQIERWYDVEILFNGKVPDKRFFGLLDRNVPLSTILQFLQERGIRSAIEGRRVTLFF
jgi:transmembrane sensor